MPPLLQMTQYLLGKFSTLSFNNRHTKPFNYKLHHLTLVPLHRLELTEHEIRAKTYSEVIDDNSLSSTGHYKLLPN